MRIIRALLACLFVVGIVSSVSGATSLPFSDGFDSQTNGYPVVRGNAWSYSWPAYATNSPATIDGSSLSVYALDGMKLTVDSGAGAAYSNVWWSSYLKVRVHTNAPAAPTSEVAAFYVNGDDQLVASSNGNWVVVAENVATNDWIGFAAHLDYNNETWDIYMTDPGYTYGDPLRKRNPAPLLFTATAPTELTEVEATGETFIDGVVLTRSVASVDGSSPTNLVQSGGVDLVLDDVLSGAAIRYFGDSTLDDEFGVALGSLLVNGDQINIFDSSNQSWRTFTFDGQDFASIAPSNYTTEATTITPTTGIYFDLQGSGDRMAEFFAAYDSADSAVSDTTVRGGGKWNLLAVPFSVTNAAVENGVYNSSFLSGVSADVGDRIYLRTNGQWVTLRYIAEDTWVRVGTQKATVSFPAGSSFWYYKTGVDQTWGN